MKIALITDQHLDGRKGSLAFWNYWQQFYDNIFFPTLEKEGIDTVIDLGDTFDNRKSMDFNTYHRVRENYFECLHHKKEFTELNNQVLSGETGEGGVPGSSVGDGGGH